MADRKPNDDRYVDNTKGPYPDGDPRNVTLTQSEHPMEPERTGPAEHQYREDDAPASANAAEKAGVHDKTKEPVDPDKKPVGETSDDPATRARADANRPLGS